MGRDLYGSRCQDGGVRIVLFLLLMLFVGNRPGDAAGRPAPELEDGVEKLG